MYCGYGPVPKGKQRGTLQECAKAKQLRYYGMVAVKPEDVKKESVTEDKLQKELQKLKKLEYDAKYLIRQFRNVEIITQLEDATPREVKAAEKKMDELRLRRDRLVKRIKAQRQKVNNMENDLLDVKPPKKQGSKRGVRKKPVKKPKVTQKRKTNKRKPVAAR